MTAILEAGDLTPGGLRSLLEALRPDERPRLWLEGPDGWALDWWPGLAGTVGWYGANRPRQERPVASLLTTATAGRLFALSGELRWRVLPVLGERCVRTVFLGNSPWGKAGLLRPRPEVLRDLTKRPEKALLWGQRTARSGDDWIELRIPHRFRYPVAAETPASGRVGVQAVLEVWEDVQGEPHFVRLCELQPYWEE
jgi:hypothetical protein